MVLVVVVKYSSLSRSGVGPGAGILTMGAEAIGRGTLLLYRIKGAAQKEESRDSGRCTRLKQARGWGQSREKPLLGLLCRKGAGKKCSAFPLLPPSARFLGFPLAEA